MPTLLRFAFAAARTRLLVAAVLAFLAGSGGTLLVATINEALFARAEERGAIALRFAALAIALLACRWLAQSSFVRLQQAVLARLRTRMTGELVEAPYAHIEREGAARLWGVLTDDLTTLTQFFVALPDVVMHGVVVLGCLVYLASLSLPVFAFALALVVLGGAAYHGTHRRALASLRDARTYEDVLYGHFRALFEGAKELRLNRERRKAFLGELVAREVERVRLARTHGMSLYVGADAWGSSLFFFFIGAVLFVFARLFDVAGPVLSGYALVFLYMMLPMEALLAALPNIGRARVALERVERASARSTSFGTAHVPKPPAFSRLVLRSVTHRYRREGEEHLFTLGPLDLELRAGELVFLIGGNGGGKTTLAKVLVGLYPPESGAVEVDGLTITDDAARDAYRQLFSAVFSDFFLFDWLLGCTAAEAETRGQELLRLLELDHKVAIRAGAFSTTALSQGQRKRLALLAAYLEDRPVYVFDEWAADQDPLFKDVFYRRLLPDLKRRGKAVLVITHDDRYFDLADRCLKLDFGKLVTLAPHLPHGPEAAERARCNLEPLGLGQRLSGAEAK